MAAQSGLLRKLRPGRKWLLLGSALVATSVTLLVIGLLPHEAGSPPVAPISFSGTVTTYSGPGGPDVPVGSGGEWIPAGAAVTLSWTDETGGTVEFNVTEYVPGPSPALEPVPGCGWNRAALGSCSFVAGGQTYIVQARQPTGETLFQSVHYFGTYSPP